MSEQQNIYGAVPASFANPLLNIEPDTRVSENLPRATFAQRKQQFQQLSSGHQSPLFSNNSVLNANNTTNSQSKDYINLAKTSTSSKGIYQKSLHLLSNGVSPLLNKKKQQPNHYESFNLPKNIVPSDRVTAKPATVINNSTNQTNNYSNSNSNSAVQAAVAASQITHLLSSPTSPTNLTNSTSLSGNLSGQLSATSNLKAANRLSAADASILINTQTNPNSTNLIIQEQPIDNSSLCDRRKSEAIMLSLDSTSNEFDRLQQRQELMLENLNLDFETMLMNGNTVSTNPNNGNNNANSNQTNGSQFNNMIQMHQLMLQQQQQLNNQLPQSYNGNSPQQSNQQQMNGTNLLVSNVGDYGRTIQQPSTKLHHPSTIHQQIQQQRQQTQMQSNHQFANSSTNKPPLHPNPHLYKEPMYLIYDDPNTNQTQNAQFNQLLLQQQLNQQQQHKSAKNDENIYEEVDFMSLSSLRAQYADTLSLQSWKKKGGSKRGLSSATSSSFTRWFSTRKKNSPSNNSNSNSNSHTDLDENTYFEIKQNDGHQALATINKKQRQPICLPELSTHLTLSQEQLKRRMIVGSIVESENSYINSLQRLISDFKKPLEEASPPILSQNKIAIIFYRLEQILQCHSLFGIALNQCVRQWDKKEQIGEVFITSFSKYMVLEIYSQFINNFTNAMETLRKASKSKSQFAQFLQERTASSPDRLSFFGLMVKPVQRFPQFILLLDDLLKHTPADHHDRMTLQLALTQLESLADRLNERKRDSERHFAVKQLLKDYLSNSTTSSSNRYLLRMDDVYVLDLDASTNLVLKSKCRKLYLLNDMLVCVSIPSNRLKFAVNLTDVDVIDDVTPATNNLLANSVLRTKDSTSNSTSPQHCTVQRMYCDLNNLLHDLETISRISNLICSLRFHYNGLSVELTEQIAHEIRNEVRRKDAQITLIDRSCFQLRIRSKNYKDLICVQMSDPEIKKDWLTDVRIAKLALDRDNNPAWDVGQNWSGLQDSCKFHIVNENLSNSSVNLNGMTQQRVPLFVKSLAIFATTDTSQLTCALFYKLPYQPLNPIQSLNSTNPNVQPILPFYSNHQANSGGVLWICNVNQSGSQLGALATSGDDVNLIHSYELCDSHVTCLEHVDCYSVWIGLKQGRVIVIDAHSPGKWEQLATLEVAGEVVCMKHVGKYVYVGLKTGVLTLFDVTDYKEEPIIITLSQQPVTCLLQINNEVFACSGDKIWVINENQQVERSYTLSGSQAASSKQDHLLRGVSVDPNSTDSNSDQLNSNEDCDILSEQRPNLLAHCGIGLWVSLIDSSIIKLFHAESFKLLQDINVASNVKRVLNEEAPIYVTSMLATRGLLWIGTSVGIIVTLTLPRLQGVPLVSGCLNVSLHRHLGPVTILLSLTPGAAPQSNTNKNSIRNASKSRRNSFESKSAEAESIYGLYADLMKVDDYISEPRSTTASTASTAIATSVTGGSNSTMSAANANGQQMPSSNIHHQIQMQQQKLNGTSNQVTNRMAWDFNNMTISDDSTSESASSSAIYHDGVRQNLGAINQQQQAAAISQNPLGGHDAVNSKTDSIGNRSTAAGNSVQNIYEPKRPRSAQSAQLNNGFNTNANNYNNSTTSNSNTNLRAQSTNSNGRPGSVNNNGTVDSNSIYESNVNFNPQLANNQQANAPLNPGFYNSESSSNLKTALLITGGNGFKQFNQSKVSFQSTHAHAIVWEFRI